MNRAVLSALWGHWRRHPVQLVTLVLGLALATALWSGVQAINAEARSSYAAAAETLGEGRYDQLAADGGGTLPESVFAQLRRQGWLVSPVVEGRWSGVRLIGVEPLTAPRGIGPPPDGGDLGSFVSAQGVVIARPEVLDTLPATGATALADPEMAPGTVMTDIGLAQRLLGIEGQISRLLILPDQPLRQGPLPPGLVRIAAGAPEIARLTDSFHLNLTAFGLLAFATGLLIVHGAIGLAVEQRRPMLRTLRALGVPLGRLILILLAELLLLALLAGILGVVLGGLLAAALLPDVAATLRGLYGAEVSGGLTLRPAWWAAGLGIAVLGSLVAAAGALMRIARAPILDAGRGGRGIGQASAAARRQGAVGLTLIGVALVLAIWGGGIAAGFALLGAGLVGGALVLPWLLDLALRLGAHLARRPFAQWLWADARAGLPGLSLALMALLLAMAANIGVATMVASFRLTFQGFLDQRLAAELYVQAGDADRAALAMTLAEAAGAAVLPIVERDLTVSGLPAELYAMRDHPTYRDNWRFLDAVPGVWDRLAAGEGVLINEQLHRRAGLSLGAPVDIAPGVSLPVLGIHGDYGNPIGQVVLTEPRFAALFPDERPLRFGLRLDPDDVPALRTRLADGAGLPEAAFLNQAAAKQFSLDVFDRTFRVTAALNALTLGVAGLALLLSLVTLAALRLPMVAPVWALGVTRSVLGWVELGRLMLLAALTGVLALPLGLALAWALLSIVNVAAFGWRLPLFLFPGDWLRLWAVALGAAALAAAWPAWRLARTAPATLTQVFAHER